MKKVESRERPAGSFYVKVMVDSAEVAEKLYGALRRELQGCKRKNKGCAFMLEMDRCNAAASENPPAEDADGLE